MGPEGGIISRARQKSSLPALPTTWSLPQLWKKILRYQDRPENFVPSRLEITHNQWYRDAPYTVKKGSCHLTYMEQSKAPNGKRITFNWLRSETIKGRDPHLFLSQACIRVAGINKYQHNTKFCIFITCPLPTQTSTLSYPLRQPVPSCGAALLHVQSTVESISPIVARVTSLTCCGCNSSEALLSKMTDLLHSHAECEDCLSSIICVHLTS